jgi:hypothetical protein
MLDIFLCHVQAILHFPLNFSNASLRDFPTQSGRLQSPLYRIDLSFKIRRADAYF